MVNYGKLSKTIVNYTLYSLQYQELLKELLSNRMYIILEANNLTKSINYIYIVLIK